MLAGLGYGPRRLKSCQVPTVLKFSTDYQQSSLHLPNGLIRIIESARTLVKPPVSFLQTGCIIFLIKVSMLACLKPASERPMLFQLVLISFKVIQVSQVVSRSGASKENKLN